MIKKILKKIWGMDSMALSQSQRRNQDSQAYERITQT